MILMQISCQLSYDIIRNFLQKLFTYFVSREKHSPSNMDLEICLFDSLRNENVLWGEKRKKLGHPNVYNCD